MGREAPTAALIDLSRPSKARRRKSGRAKDKSAKAKSGTLEREALLTQRTLRVFDDIMALAESLDDKAGDEARQMAWRAVEDSDPVRILFAGQLLGVSGQTVREWIDKGVLEAVEGSPVKVTLVSVLAVKEIVEELRELGQDRDLVSAVLNKLELGELEGDDRFRGSLEQMKRGERGEFPARYGL
jgi:hypothetical protein